MQILGDTPNLFDFHLLIEYSFGAILEHFLFKFELDVDSFGSRRCVDDNEGVSAIVVVLISPANVAFLY